MRQTKLVGLSRMGFFSVMILFFMATRGACENSIKTIDIGFPHSFADLAEKVKPAVVNISTTSTVTVPGNPFHQFFGQGQEGEGDQFNEFFKHFSKDTPNRKMKQQSLGSDLITNKDGYIITNNHVVDKAEEIKVKLFDGREPLK